MYIHENSHDSWVELVKKIHPQGLTVFVQLDSNLILIIKNVIRQWKLKKLLTKLYRWVQTSELADFRLHSEKNRKIQIFEIFIALNLATVMFVTLWCWWLTVCDNFRMLATELIFWWHLLDVGARRQFDQVSKPWFS